MFGLDRGIGGWFGMGRGQGKDGGPTDARDDSGARPEAWTPSAEINGMSKDELIQNINQADDEMTLLLTGKDKNMPQTRWRIKELKALMHQLNTALMRFEGEEERRAAS